MRIEHAAMYVNNLEKAREFFVAYFGGRSDAGIITGHRIFVLILSALMTGQDLRL